MVKMSLTSLFYITVLGMCLQKLLFCFSPSSVIVMFWCFWCTCFAVGVISHGHHDDNSSRFQEVVATTKQDAGQLHLELQAAKGGPLIQMNDKS